MRSAVGPVYERARRSVSSRRRRQAGFSSDPREQPSALLSCGVWRPGMTQKTVAPDHPFCLAGLPHDAARFGATTRSRPSSRAGHPREALMGAPCVASAVAAIAIAALLTMSAAPAKAQPADPAIRIGASDFGGVVAGPNGPEAGVWVIAETNDLATKFAKIVGTDDRCRYVISELPKATYSRWVR